MTQEAATRIEARFRGRLGAFELDAALTAPGAGVTALFGPSGCGKTSVLRCVAGLTRLSGGYCRVGEMVWQDERVFAPTHRRALGYVFQEASLFAHLDVRRNLLFGAPASGRRPVADFDETVALLGLERLLDRAPKALSGGERQRVALGRALLSQPRLLLMDEPLSALDADSKAEILPFLERLNERLALPVLYVTHDLREVERLADSIVLMQAGRVIAAGPRAAIQADPALPLARGREAAVSLDATIEGYDSQWGLLELAAGPARFLVPGPSQARGARKRLRIAASDVSLALSPPTDSSILNLLPVRLESGEPLGAHEYLAVLSLAPDAAAPGPRLLARVTARSWARLALAPGMIVHAQIKAIALEPFRA